MITTILESILTPFSLAVALLIFALVWGWRVARQEKPVVMSDRWARDEKPGHIEAQEQQWEVYWR